MLHGDIEMGPGSLIMLCGAVEITPWALKAVAATLKYLYWGPHGVHFKDKTVPLEPMMLYGDTAVGPGPLIMMCGGVKIEPLSAKNQSLRH